MGLHTAIDCIETFQTSSLLLLLCCRFSVVFDGKISLVGKKYVIPGTHV